jgi:hypothetical protein
VPGKVTQFDRFLLSQGTGMASLVMMGIAMDGKTGFAWRWGVCGVLQTKPRPGA